MAPVSEQTADVMTGSGPAPPRTGLGCGGDHERAAELLTAGIAQSELGQLTQSVALFNQALTSLRSQPVDGGGKQRDPDCSVEHDRLAARILLSLAFPTHELGRTEESLEILVHAEELASRRDLGALTVLTRAQQGVLLLREGLIPAAVRQLDRAAQLLDEAPPSDQAKIMLNRGEAHHLLGAIRPAIADFSAAVALGRQYGLAELTFAAQHNLGFMQYLAGDLPRSLELMGTVDEAPSDHFKGVVGIDRAKVLLGAGLVAEAEATLVEACAALERTELVPLLAEAELTRAEGALLAERPELARELAERATARLRPRDNRRSTARSELVELRTAESLHDPPELLSPRAARLSTELSQLGLLDQARLAQLIGLAAQLAQGRLVTGPLPRLRPHEPIDLRLRGRLLRTRLALARDDRSTAHRESRAGLSELTAYQSQLGSLDLQTASAAYGVELAMTAIDDALAHNRPGAVLTWLERGRAISGRVQPVRPPADEQAADLLTQLRWVAGQIDVTEAGGQPADDLRRRRHQLERDIRNRSWILRGGRQVGQVPTLTELRSALGPATLVAIFRMPNRLHGLVLTADGCWTRPLASPAEILATAKRLNADLDVLALDGLPTALRATAMRSFQSGLSKLDDLLLRPLGIPDTRVVLLPLGGLAGLPWGHLPTLSGQPVTVAPSAAAWLRATRQPDQTGPVVAVAGPALRRARDEVLAVAGSWPGCRTLTDGAATCTAVMSAIDGARLAHLAAHGRHQHESPLFSSLRLSDGPLVGYDLERLTEPPQQVVLSACDLGQATVRVGDEALGLTRALLHRGTATVISGVAKVSDHGAAAMMADYHGRLAAGAPPADALADASASSQDPMPFLCFGAGW